MATSTPQPDWYEDFKSNHPAEFAQWLRDKEADELQRCQGWHPDNVKRRKNAHHDSIKARGKNQQKRD